MTDKNRQKGNESVGEKSDGLVLWQIMVAGPAGYVRREAFAGSSLAEALENVRKQGFAWVEDEGSGFPDVFVKMAAPETVGTTKGMELSEAEIEVMRDVVDDLDCELQAKYSGYPIDNHRRIRDFGVVERARAILARPAPEDSTLFGMSVIVDPKIAPDTFEIRPAPEALPVRSEVLAYIEHHKGGDNLVWEEPGGKWTALVAAPETLGAAWISEADILALLPGCYYMDPPDGGGVTPLEQLQRMAKDAARYRFIRSTTKAVRADDGEGRVEVTPEKFDAMTDISIEVHKDAEAQDAFYRAIRATKDQS